MGKSHYWAQTRALTTDEWANLTKAAKAIIETFESTFFIPMGGRFGRGNPELTDDVIAFNGNGVDGCESFVIHREIQPPVYEGGKAGYDSCKTRGLAYGRAVIAVLLYLEAVLKTHTVWSDATPSEWNDGVGLAIDALGYLLEQALEGYKPALAA
jgi:hypothetical protein